MYEGSVVNAIFYALIHIKAVIRGVVFADLAHCAFIAMVVK